MSTILSPMLMVASGAVFCFFYCWFGPESAMILVEWQVCYLGSVALSVPIVGDNLSLVMAGAVMFIASNVMMFSTTYMDGDFTETRFNWLIFLFVTSMLMLVFIPNLFLMLLGWDGLGLTSYLLVVYYSKPKSLSAGMLTALTNRIGDALILLCLGLSLSGGHWSMMAGWESGMDMWLILLLLGAACTKSAQVPFSSWLPAAMAAPTPVSALVHSSTLVTAGVFLLIRFYPYLSSLPAFSVVLGVAGSITMLMAGVCAVSEMDMKKVIALSTLSQLGVMMVSVASGFPMLAFFHLLAHALFKALLFVCAGFYIHFTSHNQDLRGAGGGAKMWLVSSCFFTANLALCGSPFLAAFYSKDDSLEGVEAGGFSIFVAVMSFIATGFTSLYTAVVLVGCLWAPLSMVPGNMFSEEGSKSMFPLIALVTGAVCGGAVFNWVLISPPVGACLPGMLKYVPILSAAFGGLMGAYMSSVVGLSSIRVAGAHMWFLAPLSSQPAVSFVLQGAYSCTHYIDQGWQEWAGAAGVLSMSSYFSAHLKKSQIISLSEQLAMSLFFVGVAVVIM